MDGNLSPPESPSHSSTMEVSNTATNNYNFTINYHYIRNDHSKTKSNSSIKELDLDQPSPVSKQNSNNLSYNNVNNDNLGIPQKNDNESKSNGNNNHQKHTNTKILNIIIDDNDDDDTNNSNNDDLLTAKSPIEHSDDTLQVTIDRYGFPMDDSIDEKEHRRQLKKENSRLLKWQDMVFPQKKGGTAAESENAVDSQIQHWNSVKNHRKLKSRIRKGVPQQLRGTVWQNLCGARERCKIECARYGSKTLYNDLKLKKKSPFHDQIWKDINRTYRKNLLYGGTEMAKAKKNQINTESNAKSKSKSKNNDPKSGTQKFFKTVLQDTSVILTPQDLEKHATPAQIALYSVLKSFSLYRKDIGYCQGMQAVTALLLMYMTEEEAFWVLASLADDTKYQMENLWRPSMPAIQLRFYQMERLVKITLPKLSSHFEKQGISSASMYQASQWFITIFLATNMRFSTIVRVWDIYLNEGLKTVFRMGVGFLKYFEKSLLKGDFEQMLELFRKGSETLDTEEYIKVCFSFKITHAQLAAFERDFNRQSQKKH